MTTLQHIDLIRERLGDLVAEITSITAEDIPQVMLLEDAVECIVEQRDAMEAYLRGVKYL